LWDDGYATGLARDVVAASDTLEGLRDVVAALVTNREARARLALSGREWAVRHWSWGKTVASYDAVFLDILHKRTDN
jgi:glycosyltransferase involved in cell wall biosynthesis